MITSITLFLWSKLDSRDREGVFMTILMLVCMLMASFTDIGILGILNK